MKVTLEVDLLTHIIMQYGSSKKSDTSPRVNWVVTTARRYHTAHVFCTNNFIKAQVYCYSNLSSIHKQLKEKTLGLDSLHVDVELKEKLKVITT